jgi:hypothetical protein
MSVFLQKKAKASGFPPFNGEAGGNGVTGVVEIEISI